MTVESEKYRGKVDDRRYAGAAVDITFSPRRCIHAARCVSQLAEVFDVEKRPWIQPDGAEREQIAGVVAQCPSGALHYDPKDGGAAEAVPAENVIILQPGGYLQFRGNLQIGGATVAIEDETRATLCRCGASEKKPFCDNSHRDIGFETESPAAVDEKDDLAQGGVLLIEPQPNGPLKVSGNFTIRNEKGEALFQAEEKTAWLCRCGASESKPFCDQSHRAIGFEAA
jgi:CDGSH-type Zn-finger protein/uncharacterized Fe-S cluster protein YjdI